MTTRSTSLSGPAQAQASSRFAWRLLALGRLYRHQSFEEQRHLMPDVIGRGHKHPHAPGSRCSSAGIHPVTV
jgi:hypothetical protein